MPIARNLLVLAGLAALLAVQSLMPATRGAAELPHSGAPTPDTPVAAIAVFAASPEPGVAELAPKLPYDAKPLGLDPEFVIGTLSGRRLPPDATFFAAPRDVRPFVLNGHGDFHHLTYYVLRDFIEPLATPYTVVNFDAHDDARSLEADFDKPWSDGLDCGNWSRFALARLPHLERVVQPGRKLEYAELGHWLAREAIAAGRFDLYPARPMRLFFKGQPDLGRFDGVARRDLLAGGAWQLEPKVWASVDLTNRITTRDVYLTVDLDVVRPEDFDDIGWGSGAVARSEIIASIQAIARSHRVLGADLTGFPPASAKRYSYEKNFETYREVAAALHAALEGSK
ncbi:MAG: hypothetical protein JNK82_17725 [Myxococcaceae bacterium]|nr:hypothetical protein [Myxococcaceae bacterium]